MKVPASAQVELYTDGACAGNPGPAAVAAVILQDGQVIKEISRSIGEATNNVAEYEALICGLEALRRMRVKTASVFVDSELLYKQLKGVYRVKNEDLKARYDRVLKLIDDFDTIRLTHVRREKNIRADKLAKQAILDKPNPVVASKIVFGEESPSSTG